MKILIKTKFQAEPIEITEASQVVALSDEDSPIILAYHVDLDNVVAAHAAEADFSDHLKAVRKLAGTKTSIKVIDPK